LDEKVAELDVYFPDTCTPVEEKVDGDMLMKIAEEMMNDEVLDVIDLNTISNAVLIA
jgi:hypothetical protein